MAGTVQLADEFVFLGTPGCIVHVAQVVFAFDVVLVVAHQLVLVGKLEKDGEETEQFLDDLRVTFAAEGFDFGDV